MIELTDEILNKYIDGELDYDTIQLVREKLAQSGQDRKRFAALQAVHYHLGKIKTCEVSPAFTSSIMSKILKNAKAKKEDRNFILSISSILIAVCLASVIYLLVIIAGQAGSTTAAGQNINRYVEFAIKNLSSLKELFTNQNVSILGSIFSLGMLVIAYFFYESLRQTKRRLSKML